ncbi:MAG: DUF2894 domain-containing protein [Aquabacterium sp.]|jgi:hypothetical protein
MSEPTLAALRAQGAHLRDPMRFRFAEALAERLSTQPPAVQALLRERLDVVLSELAHTPAHAPAPPRAASTPSPLSTLKQALEARQRATAPTTEFNELEQLGDDDDTLHSARRFSVVWEQIAAERQLAAAIHNAPENAGPLNSHRLIVRAMTRMQDLSPDYLRRFLSQMDTSLWLDQLQQQISLKDGKGRRAGAKGRR